jgi:nucleotide-binding universal stress UspA family protein
MFGGVYVLTDVLGAVRLSEEKLRVETEARLARENVPWSYLHCDGDPATTIVARSRLADVVVLSRALGEPRLGEPMPLAGDVALHARTPVLAVPPGASGFTATDTAFVAWNGSAESAYALKSAMPLLRQASRIHIVTVANGGSTAFPTTDACEYLSRHGLKAELHEVRRDGPVTDALLEAREAIGGDYMVMGAYGHSRAREYILGGVTRRMLQQCPVPLLLAH